MSLEAAIDAEINRIAREGVTCITCHRITEEFSKTNGQRTVQPGDISKPVTGTGVGGRIRKQDVLAAAEEARKPAPAAAGCAGNGRW